MNRKKLFDLILITMFAVMEIVLMWTPLGFIPIGPIQVTTLHIPAILAGILLGVKGGAIVGFVFGLASVAYATFVPNLSSFMFSPFYSVGQFSGNIFSLVIAIVPRVLLGVIAGLLFDKLSKTKMNNSLAVIFSSIIATLAHTLMVMTLIYLCFQKEYALLYQVEVTSIFTIMNTLVLINGTIEAILAALLNWPIVKAINAISNRKEKKDVTNN